MMRFGWVATHICQNVLMVATTNKSALVAFEQEINQFRLKRNYGTQMEDLVGKYHRKGNFTTGIVCDRWKDLRMLNHIDSRFKIILLC